MLDSATIQALVAESRLQVAEDAEPIEIYKAEGVRLYHYFPKVDKLFRGRDSCVPHTNDRKMEQIGKSDKQARRVSQHSSFWSRSRSSHFVPSATLKVSSLQVLGVNAEVGTILSRAAVS